ncbi:hypothetical protein [Actinomadura madurae]|uniref:hypothetical protein n=1 Tax=Actinomadura madurae TaxID=1993 RepID=UPI0020D22B6A|nr:hypothetical protein [Actinomadura madurae]MCQ0019123.1 hypothetical protein [Actinomadura madurae]
MEPAPPAALPRLDLFTTLRPAVFADQVLWAAGTTTALILGYVMWVTRRFLIVLPWRWRWPRPPPPRSTCAARPARSRPPRRSRRAGGGR